MISRRKWIEQLDGEQHEPRPSLWRRLCLAWARARLYPSRLVQTCLNRRKWAKTRPLLSRRLDPHPRARTMGLARTVGRRAGSLGLPARLSAFALAGFVFASVEPRPDWTHLETNNVYITGTHDRVDQP